jgi:glucose-6-phosphate dehydrogenase assembly protein OpcA
MNLIVVTEDEAGMDAVGTMVGEVTLEHPARIFLAVLVRGAREASLNSWISARCAIPEPGGKQICCEQITLVAQGGDVQKVPSAVTSLLVSDVPTMLLWKAPIDASDTVLRALLAVSDRALIDSSEDLAPVPALLAWRMLVRSDIGIATLGDLAWTHITAWRAVLARAFQPEETRGFLRRLDSVRIEYSVSREPRHSGLSQALMLMGWLAHVLEWKQTGSPCDMRERSLRCTFRNERGDATVEIEPVPAVDGEPGGIERVVIGAGPDFSVELREGELRSEIIMLQTGAAGRRESVVPLRVMSESELMAREMEILQRDELYERSLDLLAALVSRGEKT